MSTRVMSAFEGAIITNFESVKQDIHNCPDAVWEQKIGGDYYWQQVYHLIAGTMGMLSENTSVPELPLPQELVTLKSRTVYDGPHDKSIMLDLLEKAIPHIQNYFSKKDDNNLFDDTDFYGHKMPLISVLQIVNAHIMYHVGVFDAALRDNGAKAAIG